MTANCLIQKLKSNVDNDNLLHLDGLVLKFQQNYPSTASIVIQGLSPGINVRAIDNKFTIDGNEYTSSTIIQGKDVKPKGTPSNPETHIEIWPLNKLAFLRDVDNSGEAFDIMKLSACVSATVLRFSPTLSNCYGNLDDMLDAMAQNRTTGVLMMDFNLSKVTTEVFPQYGVTSGYMYALFTSDTTTYPRGWVPCDSSGNPKTPVNS